MLRWCILLAVPALLVACGGGDSGTTGTAPNDNAPVSAQITDGSSLLLASGASRTLTAVALDKHGQTIAGAPFTWTSSDPSIVIASGATLTGAKAGTATVTATSGSASASIAVTVTPGPVAQLVIRTQPGGATAGAPLTAQPVLEFRDAAGNLATSSSNFVAASIGSGGGSLGGTTTVQAVGGVATFTDLKVTGVSGPRTLVFTAGVLSATSASFNVVPSPTPFLLADSGAVSFSLQGLGDSATRVLNVVNTGSLALSGMTVLVTYDAGPANGWLSAQLSTPDAPAVLTLVAHGGSLAAGSYHATVQITGPGASNSPLSIGVSLTIAAQYTMSFGTSAEKVKVLDVGGSYAPTLSVLDLAGAPVKNVPVTITSRAPTVATVTADGRITAAGGGDAWVVASTPATADSVFVIVPRSTTAPVLRTDATTFTAKLGDTLFVNVVFDARSTVVGAASLAAELVLQSGSVTVLSATPATTPAPLVNQSASGLFRISLGAAAGFTGPVQVLQLKLVGRVSNTVGWLFLTALDVSGVDGGSLTAQTSSTRLPLVIR